ncbi:MAG: ADOP family duplicated permease [Gemmatimonadaceae bacterium]
MSAPRVSSPRLARWLLGRLLARDERDAFIGDLEEAFRTDVTTTRSASAAHRWYWNEVLHAPIRFGARPHERMAATSTGDGIMTNTLNDLRFAFRLLARRPGFTALAVFTLALGVGATTAIFSAVYPIIVEPLPYPHADRVHMIYEREKQDGATSYLGYATFVDLARDSKSFASMAAMGQGSVTLTGGDQPQLLESQHVSPTFFDVLGVHAALGRTFRAEDDVRNTPRVVILGNALWRGRFGGDTAIVGKTITLDALPFIVVGVMPQSFENVLAPNAQLWTPLRYEVTLPWGCRDCRHLRVVGRLKPDVTAAQASREMDVIFQRIRHDFPDKYSSIGLAMPAVQDDLTKDVRPVLFAVLGAVVLVLLIACANVTNLLLARAAQRQGELSIRAALGAERGRVVRQLLTESLLLAAIGGTLGVAVAVAGVKALVALSPAGLPRVASIHVSGPVLMFALVIVTIVGVVFGLVPAVHATRADLHQGVKQGTRRTAGSSRVTRASLVISEVALAIVLLVGSGLLLKSTARVFAVKPGFDASGLLTMQIQAGGTHLYNDSLVRAFYDRALENVRNVPGVEAAALTNQLPMSGDYDGQGTHIKAHPAANPADDPGPFRYGVSPGYIEAMRIPLIRGRSITAADRRGQPMIALVNESFAKKYWPGEDALGQLISLMDPIKGPWLQVVGIVGDVKHLSLSSTKVDGVYIPESQWLYADGAMSLVVRTKGDAAALIPAVQRAVWAVDKDQPIVRIAMASQLVAKSEAQRRFALILFEAFAFVALALAAAGIYGVLAGTVTERVREIGVRAALGASRASILGMIVRQGLGLTALGAGIGIVAALGLSRLLTSLLFGVSALDPATYVAVTAVLGVVALGACLVPALRAARVDPMETLRTE